MHGCTFSLAVLRFGRGEELLFFTKRNDFAIKLSHYFDLFLVEMWYHIISRFVLLSSTRVGGNQVSIHYRIEENNLEPGTFYARVLRGEVVNLDDLIPNAVAKTSLTSADLRGAVSALTEEIVAALAAGKTVVVDGLVTFYVSLGGSFDTPDHVITRETADLNVQAQSNHFVEAVVASRASYTQEAAGVRLPVISSVYDVTSRVCGRYTPAGVMRLAGENLKFDPEQPDEGVFVGDDVSEVRLPVYLVIGDRQIDVVAPPTMRRALTVTVRTRYTPDGELRQTTFRRRVSPTLPVG